jgi:adenosylcobinamide-GDP ribazoletransferase
VKRAVEAARSAFSYFSTIPLGRFGAKAPPDQATLVFLPLVGAVIGAVSGGAGLLAGKVAPEPWPAIVAFAGLLILSGAIHVDGFLDCCDAYLASVPAERRSEILKDPRHGTYAVVGMALLTVVWVAALLQIAPRHLFIALIVTGVLSRWAAIVLVVLTGGYHRLPGDVYGATIVLAEVALLVTTAFVWH